MRLALDDFYREMAKRSTDIVSDEELRDAYYEREMDHFANLFYGEIYDDVLREHAVNLGLISEGEELILVADENEEYEL